MGKENVEKKLLGRQYFLRGHDPPPQGVSDQVGLALKAELSHEVGTVSISRPRTDPKSVGDFSATVALST